MALRKLVILGKYLNPDLYLGYSQGLFLQCSIAALKLGEKTPYRIRSGSEQSVDLFLSSEPRSLLDGSIDLHLVIKTEQLILFQP